MYPFVRAPTCGVQEQGVTDLLMAPGQLATAIPGCSGTRNLSDNLSDLRAQVSLGLLTAVIQPVMS